MKKKLYQKTFLTCPRILYVSPNLSLIVPLISFRNPTPYIDQHVVHFQPCPGVVHIIFNNFFFYGRQFANILSFFFLQKNIECFSHFISIPWATCTLSPYPSLFLLLSLLFNALLSSVNTRSWICPPVSCMIYIEFSTQVYTDL